MTALEFARVHPPRPLEPAILTAFLLRLASDATEAPVAFETRAHRASRDEDSVISYWFGTNPEHLRWLRRLCHDLLPGIVVDTSLAERRSMTAAVQLTVSPQDVALATDRPEQISRSMLSSLHQRLDPGEEIALQVLLGSRRSPSHLKRGNADPTQSWWSAVLVGTREAPPAVARQIEERQSEAGIATVIRFAATTIDVERRKRLFVGLLGGISAARTTGTFMRLERDRAERFDRSAPPGRWRLAPSATELTGLLAWPLGQGEFPGLPPVHPRQLPAPPELRRQDNPSRQFAVSTAPGDSTPIGQTPQDSLLHSVVTGTTGSGKSNVLLHLIRADIDSGRPVVVIDPKKQLIDDIIERAVPRHRVGEVVIIDASQQRVAGFNPLDVRGRDPDVVVDGLLAVFAAVFSDGWGPRTADVMHSTLLTLARVNVERAEPFTLLDVPRLLTEQAFRRTVIGRVADDPALAGFWSWYESQSPKAMAAATAPLSNKLRQYLLRPAMRRVLGQPAPRFHLRDMFTSNRVVLVPLNDALIGPVTAQLLGGLIVAETWLATLARATEDSPMRRPASVWIDEVQNYLHLPTSLDAALNASRSMGVSWNVAHQFRAQLPLAIAAAVDTNARTKVVFAPGDPRDAAAYARMAPELEERDFMGLGRFEAYATIAVDGISRSWCSIRTLPPPRSTGLSDLVRAAAHQNYAQDLAPPATSEEIPEQTPVGRKRRGRRS